VNNDVIVGGNQLVQFSRLPQVRIRVTTAHQLLPPVKRWSVPLVHSAEALEQRVRRGVRCRRTGLSGFFSGPTHRCSMQP